MGREGMGMRHGDEPYNDKAPGAHTKLGEVCILGCKSLLGAKQQLGSAPLPQGRQERHKYVGRETCMATRFGTAGPVPPRAACSLI